MEEVFVFGLAIGGVMSLMMTAVLIRLGDMIDRFPMSGDEAREKSLWSPREFTRLSVLIYWPLFGIGAYMLLQPEKMVFIGGIAMLFGLVLFLLTAVIFSIAVYNLMRSKNSGNHMPSSSSILMEGIHPFRKSPLLRLKSPRYGVSANRK
jgi:hypothetical protein